MSTSGLLSGPVPPHGVSVTGAALPFAVWQRVVVRVTTWALCLVAVQLSGLSVQMGALVLFTLITATAFTVAFETSKMPQLIQAGVVVLMSSRAIGRLIRQHCPAQILRIGDWFQVGRVNTRGIHAEMVEDQPFGNVSNQLNIRKSVCGNPSYAKGPVVETPVARAHLSAVPQPTGLGFLDLLPESLRRSSLRNAQRVSRACVREGVNFTKTVFGLGWTPPNLTVQISSPGSDNCLTYRSIPQFRLPQLRRLRPPVTLQSPRKT